MLALVGCAPNEFAGPTLTPAQVAEHLDSLAVAAQGAGDTLQAELLTALETPLAFGAPLSIVQVSVDSLETQGTFEINQTVWFTDGYAVVDTVSADTLLVFTVSEDTYAGTVLLVQRHGMQTFAAVISGDSTYFEPEPSAVHVTAMADTGKACALTIPAKNPAVTNLAMTRCQPITISSADTLVTSFPERGYISGIWVTRYALSGVVLRR